MPTTKKKKIVKKKPVKKIVKKVTKKPVKSQAARIRRRKLKEQSEDIIFDSTVGSTKALFVSNPEPAQPNLPPPPDQKELDTIIADLPNLPEAQPAPEEAPQQQPAPQQPPAEKKVSIWKKIFPFLK